MLDTLLFEFKLNIVLILFEHHILNLPVPGFVVLLPAVMEIQG